MNMTVYIVGGGKPEEESETSVKKWHTYTFSYPAVSE